MSLAYFPIPWAQLTDCQIWCRGAGLECSLPARMAHAIMHSSSRRPMAFPPELPTYGENPDIWEELFQWRYPKLDLNLLQLAILFHHSDATLQLWTPYFLREEIYTDASSKLVNHPVHLLLNLNPELFHSVMRLWYIRDEFLYKEGTVDLTRLWMSHSRKRLVEASTDSQLAQVASAFLCVSQGRAAQENPLELLLERQGYSQFPYASSYLVTRINFALLRWPNPNTVRTVMSHLKMKLEGHEAPASTVELLLDVVGALSSQGITSGFYCTVLPKHLELDGELGEAELLLACQLCWAMSEEDIQHDCVEECIHDTIASAVAKRVAILRAVRYLPTNLIISSIGFLKAHESVFPVGNSRDSSPFEAAAESLKNYVQQRSLKDLCVLSFLKAVRGDARKILSLNDYLQALKEFHVPFRKVHQSV